MSDEWYLPTGRSEAEFLTELKGTLKYDGAFLFRRIKELEARVEDLLMSRGRKQASLSVFMSAVAKEARNGRAEWGKDIVARADAAALSVKREDLVVARTQTAIGGDDE